MVADSLAFDLVLILPANYDGQSCRFLIKIEREASMARCKQWDELMQTFQEKIPEAGEDEWWALMEPVYEL